jgi:hypothetical protein
VSENLYDDESARNRQPIRHSANLAERHALRSFDSMHLASALLVGGGSHEELRCLAFDDGLNPASRQSVADLRSGRQPGSLLTPSPPHRNHGRFSDHYLDEASAWFVVRDVDELNRSFIGN